MKFLEHKPCSEFAKKEDVDKLIEKFQRYTEAIKQLERKSSLAKDIENLKFILESLKS